MYPKGILKIIMFNYLNFISIILIINNLIKLIILIYLIFSYFEFDFFKGLFHYSNLHFVNSQLYFNCYNECVILIFSSCIPIRNEKVFKVMLEELLFTLHNIYRYKMNNYSFLLIISEENINNNLINVISEPVFINFHHKISVNELFNLIKLNNYSFNSNSKLVITLKRV